MTTSKHAYYNPNPQKLEGSDCVIRAYCKAFETDWENALLASTFHAIKDARVFNDSKSVQAFAESLGCIRHKVSVKKGGKRPTPDSLARSTTFRGKTLICSVAGHIVTVKSGKYYDLWDSGHKGVYWFYEVPEEAVAKFPKVSIN